MSRLKRTVSAAAAESGRTSSRETRERGGMGRERGRITDSSSERGEGQPVPGGVWRGILSGMGMWEAVGGSRGAGVGVKELRS